MKKKIVGITIFVLIIAIFYLLMNRANPLVKVENYRIYYGEINSKILQEMSDYDMVVVEALQFTPQEVEKVKAKKGTIVIGYISVMEIGNWDKKLINQLQPVDYLSVNGQKAYNPQYSNYIGDISKTSYQDKLLELIQARVLSLGMDGVFFDTVDRIDDYKEDNKTYKRLAGGYDAFLMKVRQKYPNLIILQNRGFSTFNEGSWQYVDCIVWEDFDFETGKSIMDRIEQLKIISSEKGVVVLTISYKNASVNKNYARQMKWKHLQQNDSTQHNSWK